MDVLLDATDNFDIRFILNDLSHKYRIPFIFAACVGSFGSTFTFIPGKTPCLQCLLKQIPITGATCDNEGIINPIIQVIASYQVNECFKLLVEDEAALRPHIYRLIYGTISTMHFVLIKQRMRIAYLVDPCNYPYLQYECPNESCYFMW